MQGHTTEKQFLPQGQVFLFRISELTLGGSKYLLCCYVCYCVGTSFKAPSILYLG